MMQHWKARPNIGKPVTAAAVAFSLGCNGFADAGECPYVQERSWGSDGYGPGQFVCPTGLAVGPSGEIYVSDSCTEHLQVFDANGNFLRMWGSQGTAPGQFDGMVDVAVASDGSVFVTDTGRHRVQKFNSQGVFVHDWGGLGSGPGQFGAPWGIAVSPAGEVFVTDPQHSRIQVFDQNGLFLRQWGTPGSGPGQFLDPRQITTDSFGNVFVSDYGAHRVQKLTANGVPLADWGGYCSTGVEDTCSGRFYYPQGLCVSAAGEIFVADEANKRVQQFTNNGSFICELGGYQLPDGLFGSIEDVAVDSNGALFVIDQIGRVVKFNRQPVPARITSWGQVKATYR